MKKKKELNSQQICDKGLELLVRQESILANMDVSEIHKSKIQNDIIECRQMFEKIVDNDCMDLNEIEKTLEMEEKIVTAMKKLSRN